MNEDQQTARVHSWLAASLPADVAHSIQCLARAEDVEHIAIMPDVHLASDVCVGVALATRNRIYPAAVGSDIGCGMVAIGFAADANLLADERAAARVLAGMYERIPAIKHPPKMVAVQLPEHLQGSALSDPHLENLKTRDGRYQLGTLGRGNHFVELQADDENGLWLMVHSGSRGMGQAITAHHVGRARQALGQGRLLSLDANSPAGQDSRGPLATPVKTGCES
jgi:tRNA-splicing ligase RtcB